MPSKGHLFLRVFLIYVITVLLGTFLAATIIVIISPNSSDIRWIGFFLMGLLFTGGSSLPTIPFLFFGHYLIYRKIETRINRTLALSSMGFIICFIPLIIFTVLWFEPHSVSELFNDDETVFLLGLSIPYAIIALLSIVGINLFFDKRKGITDAYKEGEDILDDII